MSQDKIYTVATLGLKPNEMRIVNIMLALTSHHSTRRAQGRYELTLNLSKADIVIVNADDETALSAWYELADKQPTTSLLLVTEVEQAPFTKYQCSRPFGPSKILMLLDKIIFDQRSHVPEVQIFSAKGKLTQREIYLPAQGAASARHRALVIDDSPTVRKQLVLELGSFNIKVDTAETGEQGLEMLANNRYDIIFLDVVMPGADGYSVSKIIRKNQATINTPIVMLTSKSSPFDKLRGSLAGCSAYLIKPVDYENFYQVLEGYLALTAKDKNDSDQKFA